jgi:putative OPT family oligopeptide transporter
LKFAQTSLNIVGSRVQGVISMGKYNIGGGNNDALMYGGFAASPALLGVGWIIGPKIASFILVGGLFGWAIITPLIVLATGVPSGMSHIDGFFYIWGEYVRYVGVGAMVVGGLYTIFKLRSNLASGLREAVIGIKGGQIATKERTDQDLNFKRVFLMIFALTIPVFLIYGYISNLWAVSLGMSIFAILFAFIASAIAGYMAGLLGSSNNPISGVTVSVLLITCLILLVSGVKGAGAFGIAILIAAVICCAAAISGDVLQSMACGRMIGATPRKQQIAEMIGVIAAAPFLAIVIQALDKAYGIGSQNLPAPQAFLMAGITKGILTGQMVWPFVIAGMVLAFVLILIDLPVLPVAIGIYLPFTLATPIFFGGAIRAYTNRHLKKKFGSAEEEEASDWELAIKQTDVKPKEKVIRTGLLLTAGLIAGEALMGVCVAFLIIAGLNLAVFTEPPVIPAVLIFIFLAILLAYIPLREIFAEKKE